MVMLILPIRGEIPSRRHGSCHYWHMDRKGIAMFSVNSKAARGVIMAGLGFSMAFCNVAPAFAATGTVTVSSKDNEGAKYDGYRLFKANVDADDMATDVTWESAAVKTKILEFLNTQGYAEWLSEHNHTAAVNGTPAAEIAQNACDFITDRIGDGTEANDSATDTEANTTPRTTVGSSFANALARYIHQNSFAAQTEAGGVSAGTAFTSDQGYYLFVTHDENPENTIGTDEAGTAPIWVSVGATAKVITEKTAIPTVVKNVRDDTAEEFGRWADANRNQSVDFLLTGTVADNVNAFETYFYEFVDTMEGLEMSGEELAGVVVKIDGVDVTNALKAQSGSSITFEDGVLRVTVKDLLGLATLTKDSVVTVEYKAHLNDDAILGNLGNPNTVYLNYSSNPSNSDTHTETSPSKVKTYAYALRIIKVDQETRELLPGAEFTVKVAESNSDEASVGKFVQEDGTLGDTAHTFVTDASGEFYIPCIDEGTYTITETKAPEDHKMLATDVTLTVSRQFNANDELESLSATISGGNGLFVSGTAADHQDGIVSASLESGEIDGRISDKKETYLPGTGLTMSSAGIILGGVLLTGGLFGVVRKGKGSLEDED